MIKQTLFFSTPVVLSLKNCQMVISWKDCTDKVTRPIEDIGCVVLENQMISITLPLLNKAGKDGNALRPLYMNVKSGDSDNREGLAARIYWQRLMGDDFRREREGNAPNQMLNYGYSILRAAVARALLGSGLLPNFGIFHKSRYNAFPLADDVMEPYRPYVDEIVHGIHEAGGTELTKEVKAEILRLLNCDVSVGQVRRPLQIALTITTASLAKFFKGDVKKLALPIMS